MEQITPKKAQEMLVRCKENEGNIVGDDIYDYDMNRIMYDFCEHFTLHFDIDCVENTNDTRLQQTVYINRLVDLDGYSVILDQQFQSTFETVEEFVEVMIKAEHKTIEVLSHFKN